MYVYIYIYIHIERSVINKYIHYVYVGVIRNNITHCQIIATAVAIAAAAIAMATASAGFGSETSLIIVFICSLFIIHLFLICSFYVYHV